MSRARQLAAIMFTDIVGYTALMQQNEKKAIQARNKHRQIFNSITDMYNGKILQYYGDGTLSIFNSAIDAVKCGIEMQINFRKDPEIPVRIGIHTGDIIISKEEIIGDSVNITSRIESLAVPGSVFISEKVYDEIKNQEDITTFYLKSFKLKNVERPIGVYVLSNEGLVVPTQDDIEGKTDGTYPSKKEDQRIAEKKEKNIATPILATKLYMPPPRSEIVNRARLTEKLNKGLKDKLTLISAPAGFGKTTLTSQWLSNCKRQIAWLSLDESDRDIRRFLDYLTATLQTISETIGKATLEFLQLPESPSIESVLTSLLNDIAKVPDEFVLVLDDYHAVKSKHIDDLLTYLLDYLPTQMHLVITTREDPDIPLPRLRVRQQLTELRPADLRFTSSEAAGFLNQVMGLNLSSEDITILETRTEGWIAGLQLAALSMQGQADMSSFIKTFAGDDRYIVDYLVEEVLHNQKEYVHDFLLQTSILDRLSASLCNAVTGRKDGKIILESLEHANLFIVPLDDKRHWFRYHHLFADVLHTHLLTEQPERLPELHQRASLWYEHNNLSAEAIQHALEAKDFIRAAELIELIYPAMDESFQSDIWLDWVKALPEELIRNRPVVISGYAWALFDRGEMEQGMTRLQEAERLIGVGEGISKSPVSLPAGIIVVDEEQFRFLPATIANARSYYAQVFNDIPGTVKYARQALELMPEGNHIRSGTPKMLLGIASWASGDLELAYQSMEDGLSVFQKAGNIPFAVSGTFILGDIRITQGRLHSALAIYEKSLQIVKERGLPYLPGTAELYLGMSELYHELGEKERALLYLSESQKLVKQTSLTSYRLHLAQARIYEVKGNYDGALQHLEEAERLYIRNPLPDLKPLPALKTRLWIKQNRINEAESWIEHNNLTVDDRLSFLNEFEHIVLARVLLARYRRVKSDHTFQEMIGLLVRLQKEAEQGGRLGSAIEILVLQAIAYKMQDNITNALTSLKCALTVAEPEGYVRVFLDEGIPMVELLSIATAQEIFPEYITKLLAIVKTEKQDR